MEDPPFISMKGEGDSIKEEKDYSQLAQLESHKRKLEEDRRIMEVGKSSFLSLIFHIPHKLRYIALIYNHSEVCPSTSCVGFFFKFEYD